MHSPGLHEPEGSTYPSALEEVNDLIAGLGDPATWFVTEEYAGYALQAMQQVADWARGYRQELEEAIGRPIQLQFHVARKAEAPQTAAPTQQMRHQSSRLAPRGQASPEVSLSYFKFDVKMCFCSGRKS